MLSIEQPHLIDAVLPRGKHRLSMHPVDSMAASSTRWATSQSPSSCNTAGSCRERARRDATAPARFVRCHDQGDNPIYLSCGDISKVGGCAALLAICAGSEDDGLIAVADDAILAMPEDGP